MEKEKIVTVIYKALDEINLMRSADRTLPLEETTELAGDRGMESLELVNFVVQLEQYLSDELGDPVVLVKEGMDFSDGTFDTVSSLADHVIVGL